MDALVDFLPPFCTRETTYIPQTNSLQKKVYSRRKEFAPCGSKFFAFRVDPYQKGGILISRELHPLKMFQFPLLPIMNWQMFVERYRKKKIFTSHNIPQKP